MRSNPTQFLSKLTLSRRIFESLEIATNFLTGTLMTGLNSTSVNMDKVKNNFATYVSFETERMTLTTWIHNHVKWSRRAENILHYRSWCCKRVILCMMAAEVHAPILRLNKTYAICDNHRELIGTKVDIVAYVYTKT